MPLAVRRPFAPYWTTTDGDAVRLYLGNVTEVLARLPAGSVHCVVTSPPYWQLRDYKGGPDEIGCEPHPDLFVAHLVEVGRALRRVLRDDGTWWLNLGDTFGPKADWRRPGLVGIPHRVNFALQDDGWVTAMEHIWSKPAPMPESVRNRCTKAHEYVFLLTKGPRYFYDAEAIKEGEKVDLPDQINHRYVDADNTGLGQHNGLKTRTSGRSNKRSVWTVSSQGYEGAHFATFPPKLIEPMILAGTSAYGACAKCGAPWRRVTEERTVYRERPNAHVKYEDQGPNGQPDQTKAGLDVRTVGWEPTCGCFGRFEKRAGIVPKSAARYTGGDRNQPGDAGASPREGGERETAVTVYVSGLPLDQHPVVPCTVLDPFIGSGTTCAVAVQAGRRGWGVDLSEKYLRENAVVRVKGALLARPNLTHLVPRGAAGGSVGRPRTAGVNLLRPGPRGVAGDGG